MVIMQAYVLLSCVSGYEKEIISELKAIPEVVEVNGIWGKYDIFVKISSLELFGIEKTIEKIRLIKQITASDTMHVIYGQGGSVDSLDKG